MTEIAFEYRCRRCDGVERNPHTSGPKGIVALTAAELGVQSPFMGHSVHMLSVHSCGDGGKGVSDLIGYAVVSGARDQSSVVDTDGGEE